MERREAPGVCETPHGETLARGFAARRHQAGVRIPPARRARYGIDGVAKPTARTLRLPALHQKPRRLMTARPLRPAQPLRVMSGEG